MGSIKINVFVILILISFTSCSLIGIDHWFELGKDDENGQYVPKHDRFKFKDKPNNVFPPILDTINIYKLMEAYRKDYMVYPINTYSQESYPWLKRNVSYIKFYSNGRCLSFSIPTKNETGLELSLTRADLNPNNPYSSKDYFYCKDGKKIQIENFIYGEGYGMYVIFDYFLNETGDTLKMIYKNSVDVYVKEKLPSNWEKYKVDW